MSKFLEDMQTEAAIRVRSYQAERDTLRKASARIAELDALIIEASAEVDAYAQRIPKEEKADAEDATRG